MDACWCVRHSSTSWLHNLIRCQNKEVHLLKIWMFGLLTETQCTLLFLSKTIQNLKKKRVHLRLRKRMPAKPLRKLEQEKVWIHWSIWVIFVWNCEPGNSMTIVENRMTKYPQNPLFTAFECNQWISEASRQELALVSEEMEDKWLHSCSHPASWAVHFVRRAVLSLAWSLQLAWDCLHQKLSFIHHWCQHNGCCSVVFLVLCNIGIPCCRFHHWIFQTHSKTSCSKASAVLGLHMACLTQIFVSTHCHQPQCIIPPDKPEIIWKFYCLSQAQICWSQMQLVVTTKWFIASQEEKWWREPHAFLKRLTVTGACSIIWLWVCQWNSL